MNVHAEDRRVGGVRVASLCLVLIVLAFASQPARAEPATAGELVSGFHETLLDIMKNADSLGVKGRYDKLAPRIKETFHLKLMARITSGSFWKKADDQQRDLLTAAFSHLSIATYAAQVDGYSGQSFNTTGEKSGPQNTTLVSTQIIDPGGDDVDLIYVTREFKGKWRIVDVVLDSGISELAVRRSEYRRGLKKSGVEGLIKTLNAKADALVAE
jgi:phospholipid transport system substrate-binding protein